MIGGHGHVTPRPDGMKARCGGPALCGECALEAGLLELRQERMREIGERVSPPRSQPQAEPIKAKRPKPKQIST